MPLSAFFWAVVWVLLIAVAIWIVEILFTPPPKVVLVMRVLGAVLAVLIFLSVFAGPIGRPVLVGP